MIIKEIKLNNTKILIDNEFLPKNEKEKEQIYKNFNSIACLILENKSKK